MNIANLSPWLPSYLAPFVTLSYPVPPPAHPDSFEDSSYYGIGRLDACFLVTSIVLFALARDVSRLYLLEPLARWKLLRDAKKAKRTRSPKRKTNGHANGVANGNGHVSDEVYLSPRERKEIHRKVLRFAEQGWSFIYYVLQWSYGLYIYRGLPATVFKTDPLWVGYPHYPLAGPVKIYYLTETAFYMHSVLVLHAEEHRADHIQMMSHHVITIALMICSYFYNFTRVGCIILILMDWNDIWLPLAKMLRYLNFQTLCDAAFVVFLLSWLVARHVFFILIIISTWYGPSLAPFAWIPEKGYWFTKQVHMVFVILLVSLQGLQLLWFVRICQVAWKVVTGQGAEDNRSGDELEDDDEEEEERKER